MCRASDVWRVLAMGRYDSKFAVLLLIKYARYDPLEVSQVFLSRIFAYRLPIQVKYSSHPVVPELLSMQTRQLPGYWIHLR